MAKQDEIIEITAEDGTVTKCELFDMIEFNNKYYALLVEESHIDDDEPEIFIFRYRDLGEDVMFEQITDEEEFNEVSQFVESLPNSEEE